MTRPITTFKGKLLRSGLLLPVGTILSVVVITAFSFMIHVIAWTEPMFGYQFGVELGQGSVQIMTAPGRQYVSGIAFHELVPVHWWIEFGRTRSSWRAAVPTWMILALVGLYYGFRLARREQ